MPRKGWRKGQWIVIDTRTGEWKCERCGQTHTPQFPMPLLLAGNMMKAFFDTHKDCKEPKKR